MNIKIGGHNFTIIYEDLPEMCGQLDRTTNQLKVDKTLSESQQHTTIIHELIHSLNNEIPHETVDALAEQFYQVFKDNPELTKYLFDGTNTTN